MTEYPWNLRGGYGTYKGEGNSGGETQRSGQFNLKQGLVIAEIAHQGSGDFKLEFVSADGIGRGKATPRHWAAAWPREPRRVRPWAV